MTNVFAHINDLDPVVAGLKTLVGSTGVIVIEFPYLIDMIDSLYFDTIYHEHLSYFCLTPLKQLFDRHGLEIICR